MRVSARAQAVVRLWVSLLELSAEGEEHGAAEDAASHASIRQTRNVSRAAGAEEHGAENAMAVPSLPCSELGPRFLLTEPHYRRGAEPHCRRGAEPCYRRGAEPY